MEKVEVADSVRPESITPVEVENQVGRHPVNEKEVSPVVNGDLPDGGEASKSPLKIKKKDSLRPRQADHRFRREGHPCGLQEMG